MWMLNLLTSSNSQSPSIWNQYNTRWGNQVIDQRKPKTNYSQSLSTKVLLTTASTYLQKFETIENWIDTRTQTLDEHPINGFSQKKKINGNLHLTKMVYSVSNIYKHPLTGYIAVGFILIGSIVMWDKEKDGTCVCPMHNEFFSHRNRLFKV